MNHKLERELKNLYGGTSPAPNPEHMRQTIYLAKKKILKIESCETDISFWTFFWSQLEFIKKRVWVTQFAVVLLFGIGLFNSPGDPTAIGALSAFLPLCFLAGTGELSQSFVHHTAETELSTHFTLSQVMLCRITLLGLTNIFILSFASLAAAAHMSANLIHIFMYFCVPFLLTSFGCLYILNHIHTKECNYYCGAWCAVVISVSFGLSMRLPLLYETSLIGCWYLLFLATLSGLLFECRLLIRNCKINALKSYAVDGGF